MRQIYLRFKCTDLCNLSCPFCHKEGISSCCKSKMSIDLFKRIITVLLEAGLSRIKFTGGEPTLCQNLLDYINICKESGVQHIGVVTNGTQKDVIEKIIKEYGDVDITISIPSFDAKEYQLITGGNLTTNFVKFADDNSLKHVTINHIILSDTLTDEWFEKVLEVAVKVKKIKFLIPCNVSELKLEFESDKIFTSIKKFLVEKGFCVIKEEANHIYYSNGEINNLVITPPYCPVICSKVDSITLRLTSEGILKPCFMENTENLVLTDEMSDDEIKNNVLSISNNFHCPYAQKESQNEY